MSIILRPWIPGDAEALQRAWQSAPDLATQFGSAELTSPVAALAYIEETLVFEERAKNWALVQDGIAVGNVAATAIEFRHATAWISYWLTPAARGRGHATGAVLAVSDWAFRHGLHRLELGHRVNNPSSCRVATAAGFQAEGIEREKLRYGAERFDVELHARLRSDPAPASPRPLAMV
jgi:RimJ/RimL family protein N-acetyltransferase